VVGDENNSKQTLGSVNRALDVLEAFTPEQPSWGLSPLARELDIGKATLHRLLKNLEDRGYVMQDEDTRLYRLGFRPLRIAQAALVNTPSEVALPHLRRAARTLGEQTTLWVLEGSEAVCVAKVPGTNPLRAHTNLGAREPARFLASGRCLLAHRDTADQRRILGKEYEKLADELSEARQQGYVISNRRWPEVMAVSAPVRDHRGRVIAAMSLSGPAARLHGQELANATETVRSAALETSKALGYELNGTVD
jgi:IclR family transcriptional regulator, KDG regulon repressor